MKRVLALAAMIAFVFCLAACGSAPKAQTPPPPQILVPMPSQVQTPMPSQAQSPPPPRVQTPPPLDYRKAAIELVLKADPRLNLYQATPHTLVACIYELRDPNGFNQLIDERDGLLRLLECGRFDGSVAYVKKCVLQPGQKVSEVLDRAEGAKYLGLVAGYFAPGKEKPYRLYRIPTVLGGDSPSMKVNLYLGPQKIEDMR